MPQKPLNKKEIKKIIEIIKNQWNADVKLDYAFFISERNRLYIINKEIVNFDLSNLRINSIGLYFGELINNSLRLSIEGSQITGPYAKKNVIGLDGEDVRKWFRGDDVEISALSNNHSALRIPHSALNSYSGFVIIKNKNDFVGCGKVVSLKQTEKHNKNFCSTEEQKFCYKILNYVPKNRRVKSNF